MKERGEGKRGIAASDWSDYWDNGVLVENEKDSDACVRCKEARMWDCVGNGPLLTSC